MKPRNGRWPYSSASPVRPEPEGFVGLVARTACTLCKGWCCKGGEEHAYLDERTMARVRRDHPEHDARAIIRLYLDRLAARSYRGSCLFHGADGCTLGRGLRAHLCDAYFCDGLRNFQRLAATPERVRIVARRGGRERRSDVLANRDEAGNGGE